MILTGSEINKMVNNGDITLSPFDPQNITTNTYDLSIGNEVLIYTEEVLDPKKKNEFEIKKIPENGMLLKKNDFVVASSSEIVGSDKYVPKIHAKSGTARKGLFVHVTADIIDIGYHGNLSFQLYATQNIIIYPNQKIAQVSFWVPTGDIMLYGGKYQGGQGPQESKTYLNYDKNNL